MEGAAPGFVGQVERALRRIDGEGPEDVRGRVLEPRTVEHRRRVLWTLVSNLNLPIIMGAEWSQISLPYRNHEAT